MVFSDLQTLLAIYTLATYNAKKGEANQKQQQLSFWLVSHFSLTLSLGYLLLRCVMLQRSGQVTKLKKIVTLT